MGNDQSPADDTLSRATCASDIERACVTAEAKLRAVIETAAEAIVVIDSAGVMQSVNPATTSLFGYGAGELLGRNVSLLMAEPHCSAHDGYIAAYLSTGHRKVIGFAREVEGRRKNGSILPVELGVAEWEVEGQRFFTGLMRDISARRAAQAARFEAERRELVVSELRHRIINMFTVVSSLVTLTARSQSSVPAFRDALLKRIGAFAASQIELARRGWSSGRLLELVRFELTPYLESGLRVSIAGDEIILTGAAAESLAMVLHELATNAAKYGALSTPDGALDVDWKVVSSGPTARLILHWTERHGLPMAKPKRRGFGATVLDQSARALGGVADLNFVAGGLRFTLDVPAGRVLAEP